MSRPGPTVRKQLSFELEFDQDILPKTVATSPTTYRVLCLEFGVPLKRPADSPHSDDHEYKPESERPPKQSRTFQSALPRPEMSAFIKADEENRRKAPQPINFNDILDASLLALESPLYPSGCKEMKSRRYDTVRRPGIYTLNGNPALHTLIAKEASSEDEVKIRYAIDHKGDAYFGQEGMATHSRPGHENLIANGASLAAGNIWFELQEGVYKITRINNTSSAYEPNFSSVIPALITLYRLGIPLADTIIAENTFGKDRPKGEYLISLSDIKRCAEDSKFIAAWTKKMCPATKADDGAEVDLSASSGSCHSPRVPSP